MELKVLKQELSVCKVREVPAAVYGTELYFIGKTDEELSLVCETSVTPDDAIAREDGWRGFRIEGVLDFSLTGILSRISGVLADVEIGIFAVSTYNTDYVLVKAENLEAAMAALGAAGYVVKN
ncbi:MAG: ACT domain-containing protein [Eggerthellaceae bacterium]|nr:ACT domain-containing protein [Eggerthellaceae bacterium]